MKRKQCTSFKKKDNRAESQIELDGKDPMSQEREKGSIVRWRVRE